MRKKGLRWLFLAALAALGACETEKASTGPGSGTASSLRASEPPPRIDPAPLTAAFYKAGQGAGGQGGGEPADKGRELFDGDNRGLKDAPGAVSVGNGGTKKVLLSGDSKPDGLRINEPPSSLLAGPFTMGDLK